MTVICPKQDLSLDPSRIAVFEDSKATALTTQPPWLDGVEKLNEWKIEDSIPIVTWLEPVHLDFPGQTLNKHKELEQK